MAKKQNTNSLADTTRLIELLKEEAKQRAEINSSLDGYVDGLKKAKALSQTIRDNNESLKKLQSKIDAARKTNDVAEEKLQQKIYDILKKQTKELEDQKNILGEQLKEVNVNKMAMAKAGAAMVKGLADLPNLIENSFGKLKQYGLFQMDKSIKTSALQMGLLSKQSDGFRKGLVDASYYTNQIGVDIEELSKIQGSYSDELGRTVTLTQDGLKAMADMAAATGLGAEGAAKLAADMDNFGYSAERTAGFVQQVLDDSHKMGVNASKVVKNIQNNIKLLNKYNFKGGVKGLAKMAETTTKLGVDMNFVSGMADKLFDIEGAVDMSAQLQVLGGEWAKLADPFKLMYMARNDMEGLTEAMANAAAASAKFNKQTGEFDISALEMHRLRKVAEQTGVSYEELAQAAKNAAKFSKIKSQLSFSIAGDKDLQEFLTSQANFNDKGEATININGSPKLIKQLTSSDKQLLKSQVLEKQSMAERAKTAQTFDDQLTNLINTFKTAALPIIETLNKELMPKMKDLFKRFEREKWADKIGALMTGIGKLVSGIAGFVIDNPIKTAFIVGAAKIGSFLIDKASWVLNGLSLAEGFNMGTANPTGGILGNLTNVLKGNFGKLAGGLVKLGGYVSLAASTISLGMSAYKNYSDKNLGFWDATWKTLKENAGKIVGGVVGGVGGFLVGGPAGAIAGAGYGSQIGGMFDSPSEGANDAVFNRPINDGISSSLGSDFSKGRAIVEGGQVTPIDNKDDLLAYKPNGPVDNAIKGGSESKLKVEFGEIHFRFDELRVTAPGSPGVAVDLLKNPEFIKNITRMVHIETSKAINGGKINPNPR